MKINLAFHIALLVAGPTAVALFFFPSATMTFMVLVDLFLMAVLAAAFVCGKK